MWGIVRAQHTSSLALEQASNPLALKCLPLEGPLIFCVSQGLSLDSPKSRAKAKDLGGKNLLDKCPRRQELKEQKSKRRKEGKSHKVIELVTAMGERGSSPRGTSQNCAGSISIVSLRNEAGVIYFSHPAGEGSAPGV